MILSDAGIDYKKFSDLGYDVPKYDRNVIRNNTLERPEWIHFGAGNIFRAFQARVMHELLNKGIVDTGLVVAEGYDYEIIEKMNKPHDDLSIAVTLRVDGKIDKAIVGSVVSSYCLDRENKADYDALKKVFSNQSLKMASFTITEKGYSIRKPDGEYYDAVKADILAGPEGVNSYTGKVVALLYERFINGAAPISMVSMDNCSHNGDKLKDVCTTFAKEWADGGKVDAGFVSYVNDVSKVGFPWSMIDKITPRPDANVEAMLKEDFGDELSAIITSKNTYVAPFVNAEECEYLVIEDWFPNGKPNIAEGGIIFTDRETVDKVEKMKVCTCLNPIHTTLAVFGCLLSYNLISREMENPVLNKLARKVGYEEGLKVVVDPGIISPKQFIDEVFDKRIPNPFMPDTPQRIATDTSQKVAIRFGETIKAYQASADLDVDSLVGIPLVIAGWLRYLLGINDNGETFNLSSDPRLDELKVKMSNNDIKSVLSDETLFGLNLYDTCLAERIEGYFEEMSAGKGAIIATLQKYL